MTNDVGFQSCSARAGKSRRFLPSTLKSIIRSASSLASTVKSASSSVASSLASAEEERQCDELRWAGFDKITLGSTSFRHVLLLAYRNGFQVWDVEEANDLREFVSKRDGPVFFLRVQQQPCPDTSDGILNASRPLLVVVTADSTAFRSNCTANGQVNGYGAIGENSPSLEENHSVPTIVKFYSLRNHAYVHILRFRTAIYAVQCSPRIVAVALAAQLYCFDAATLQSTFSVLTYPYPASQLGSNHLNWGYGALAVGPRWLAYSGNQPVTSNTGRVSPQHLTPSPGASPSSSPANGSFVAHYAKESSKQIAAGIINLGDLGIKAISRYYSDGTGSPVPGNPVPKGGSNNHSEIAGTVIVRDFVTKTVISQFRAHTSPLSALCFDPTGTLLVSASIHGHTINVFRIMPTINTNGGNTGPYDVNASHVHLYKLSRGMTNAVIQDIAFSKDSHWISVSTSRGTSHLFSISPFGGAAKVSSCGSDCVSGATRPWWSNLGPVKSTQQNSSVPQPATVNSSVISRIRNGYSSWCGTVMDAAAAAASNGKVSLVSPVCASFHGAQGFKFVADACQNGLKEQVWVLSPSGHLIQYSLRITPGTDGHANEVPPHVGVVPSAEAQEVKVIVEPLQKWDVCRRHNWIEREEKMDSLVRDVPDLPGTSSCATAKASYRNGASHGREDLTPEEMHRLFLCNAEVCMHHFRPPLWAKTQVSFYVFVSGVANGNDDSGGEVEIEKVNTRKIEVKKKDLVPVFDRFKDYRFREDLRDFDATHVPHAPGGLHSGTQNGNIGMNFGGIQIQRYCSGSNGIVYSSSNAIVHRPYQDLPVEHSGCHQHEQTQPHLRATLKDAYFTRLIRENDGTNSHGDSQHPFAKEHVIQSGKAGLTSMRCGNQWVESITGGLSDEYLASASDKSSGIASNGIQNNVDRLGHHEFQTLTEDVRSNDSNSRNEDFGGHGEDVWEGGVGEQGEDGWEGTMFPFAED